MRFAPKMAITGLKLPKYGFGAVLGRFGGISPYFLIQNTYKNFEAKTESVPPLREGVISEKCSWGSYLMIFESKPTFQTFGHETIWMSSTNIGIFKLTADAKTCDFMLKWDFDVVFLAQKFNPPLQSFLILKICILDHIKKFMGVPRFFGTQKKTLANL